MTGIHSTAIDFTAINSSYPKRLRLRRRAEYQAVYQRGRRLMSPHFVLFALRRQPGSDANSAGSRFGITASAKLGGAVVRNRVRRRTRELLRRHAGELGPGWDVVVNPRLSMLAAPFAELDSEIEGLLLRLRQSLG